MTKESIGRRPLPLDRLRVIKEWTRSALGFPDDTTVFVSELECKEPGCPPRETIIAVLNGPHERLERKLHIALVDVTREQVVQLLKSEA